MAFFDDIKDPEESVANEKEQPLFEGNSDVLNENEGTESVDDSEDFVENEKYYNRLCEDFEKLSGIPSTYFNTEVYRKRGFIKDGELVTNAEEVLGVHGSPLPTYTDGVSMSICSEECLIAILSKQVDIEKTLLYVLSSSLYYNEKSHTKIGTQLPIYVFRPFDNKTSCDVNLPKNLNEFLGEYTFINTCRGWKLLNFHRAIAIPV